MEKQLSNYYNKSDEIVFAFDLHGVVLQPRFRKIYTILLRNLFSRKFFSTLKVLLYVPFWYQFFKEKAVSENKVLYLVNNTCFSRSFFIDLINQQELNKPLLELLSVLKQQGYTIVVASNVWPDLLTSIRNKYHELDELFEDYFIPQMVNYVEKPDEHYYHILKEFLLLKQKTLKLIFFIDDLSANIAGARKEQLFVPLHYTSVHCLKKDLRRYRFTL